MPSAAFSLLVVTMALSIVMLFVLQSLAHSGARGIREWTAANALAVVALPLFAVRGKIPDPLSVELANTLLLGTSALMLAGFRRCLDRRIPWWRLLACIALGLGAIVWFHDVHDAINMRVVAMSLLHGAFCLEGALVVRQALGKAPRAYPYLFTSCAGLFIGAAYLARAVAYARLADGMPLLADATLNVLFFAMGTVALPMLTLGAVMMTNAGIIARATYAADHDYLTGARSRRAFFDLAERERMRAQRTRASLSLLLFDVDHFKRINDTHGHATGDRVLVDIVARTRTVVRGIDVCARLGGEEFAVLLPDTGHEMALRVAERLRAAFDTPPRPGPGMGSGHGQTGVPYTVSLGAATLEAGETIAALLSRADQALYAAKAGGRNTVVAALSSPASSSTGLRPAKPPGTLRR